MKSLELHSLDVALHGKLLQVKPAQSFQFMLLQLIEVLQQDRAVLRRQPVCFLDPLFLHFFLYFLSDVLEVLDFGVACSVLGSGRDSQGGERLLPRVEWDVAAALLCLMLFHRAAGPRRYGVF